MKSNKVRQHFLDFFQSKGHQIVPSAPLVAKDDPTLMFINAGMNPFKDYFLGNKDATHPRVANTQRCLRVSGKHNDLEEVGRDSYHHTMFEMLGNWSFGDYFKIEAINWAWELLTEVYKLPKDRLYVTYFGGDASDHLEIDTEALDLWKQHVKPEQILPGSKKDNFWEMGDTGPCGPCSEIHIDIRPQADRDKVSGADLVNQDHPLVIEIWNLVFMQFNRRADGSLHPLPNKHVDTGMGLERLCMALQGKQSNYETDLFRKHIEQIEGFTGIKYTNSYASDAFSDIAMRVIGDHLRAVCFAIADGQLPSNNGAGYVIRRILRRAVRYYFSFLHQSQPLLYKLIPGLAAQFEGVFPELKAQQEFVIKVVMEEEKTFLRTLESGLKRMEQFSVSEDKTMDGKTAFELYDTYGFPIDLTLLIAGEKGWNVDIKGFEKALANQRNRSRKDAEKATGDWVDVHGGRLSGFQGYEAAEISGAKILAYRELEQKGAKKYQLLLDETPFYPEGGGQMGDTGFLIAEEGGKVKITNTVRENDLIIHESNALFKNPESLLVATIDLERRKKITANHTATHLLHAALQEVLGDHVEQRGSLVHPEYLRFDFSHFAKLSEDEILKIENIVNRRIAQNLSRGEARNLPIDAAKAAGAKMLFGEKYGDTVRMITFDKAFSVELCGGCHVDATGEIGWFKIKHEGAIAAGIRRIEALTGDAARDYINRELQMLQEARNMLKQSANIAGSIEQLQEENKQLRRQMEAFQQKEAISLGQNLETAIESIGAFKMLVTSVPLGDAKSVKDLVFSLKDKHQNLMGVITATINDKPNITVFAGKMAVEQGNFNAGALIRDLAAIIQGGGGGQPFFATAGGKDAAALPKVHDAARDQITKHINRL